MLQTDPQSRYIVTNAEALRPHEGAPLFDFPEVDQLPPHTRAGHDAPAQASLAPRIVLLTGVTREVLCGRISALLAQHGHVPISKHDDCLRDLREAVRQRTAGAHGGRWTRCELVEVRWSAMAARSRPPAIWTIMCARSRSTRSKPGSTPARRRHRRTIRDGQDSDRRHTRARSA